MTRRTSRFVKRRTSRLAPNGPKPKQSARRSTSSGDVRRLIEVAESQGWAIGVTGGNHLRFIPPDRTKPMVHMSSTPSDHRAVKNLEGQLRRAGLVLPRMEARKKKGRPRKNVGTSRSWLQRGFPEGSLVEFILGDRRAGVPPGTTAVVQAVRGDGMDVSIERSSDTGLLGENVSIEMTYEKDGQLHRTSPEQLALYLRRLR
jgi:hypothetical protein